MEHLPLFSTETLSVIGFHAISFWSELGCRCGAMHFEIVENRASFHMAALSATPAVLPLFSVWRRSNSFADGLWSSAGFIHLRHLAMETFVRVYMGREFGFAICCAWSSLDLHTS